MKMSMAEKILSRASGKDKVSAGEYVVADIDKAISHEAFAAVYLNLLSVNIDKIHDPDKVIVVLDHYVPAPTQRAASIHQLVKDGVAKYGIKNFYAENYGIAHQVMVEQGHVSSGDLIVGSDSHTCTYGALGAAACGIGVTELTYALATEKLWFRVPETIRFLLTGNLDFPIASKDIILKIAGEFSTDIAQYKSIEFTGPLANELSIASRMTMSNMAVEIGAKFGFFTPDEKTFQYTGRPPACDIESLYPDEDTKISEVYEIDVSNMEPQVALPHSVGNVKPVTQVENIEIQQAVLGSCTNGRLEDLQIAAKLIKGRKVHPGTRLLVIPASWKIYRSALDDGTLQTLIDAGGIVLNSGCGPCFGGHMGILANGEKCISSTNRNFKGRMGNNEAEIYLSSPATVVASAIHGQITDPREL